MADELIALFGKITTNDHEALVEQFSKVLQVEPHVSTFFLEASSWNVETAVHNYLASVGTGRNSTQMPLSPPQAVFLGDISPLENRSFPPGSKINLQLGFRNVGSEPWPSDTRLCFVDGHVMNSQESMPISAPSGGVAGLVMQLVAPLDKGTYMGSWRLACSAGYFGDAIYIIVNVNNDSNTEMETGQQGNVMGLNTAQAPPSQEGFGFSVQNSLVSPPLSHQGMGIQQQQFVQMNQQQFDQNQQNHVSQNQEDIDMSDL